MSTLKKIIIFTGLALPTLFFTSLYIPIPKGRLHPSPIISLRLVDRNNVFLREVLSEEEGRCRWIEAEEISPSVFQAAVAAEDKHFFLHNGIDLFASGRALFQNLKHARVVSGASTITQQLIRNIYSHRHRTILMKVVEAWQALRLERKLSKKDILVQYLNRAFYGNQAYGIDAASRLYFKKPAASLSTAEAAFLAGLPRSPRTLNPYRFFPQVKKRQQDILKRMHALDFISSAELNRSLMEPLHLYTEKERFRAPHFCDFILAHIPSSWKKSLTRIQTTLDYSLQEKVERLVKYHLASIKERGITNAAVVVMDNASTEILCMVGSRDFFDEQHDGQVNGALSLRQPGSTLKPFTYGLALEKGLTAAQILEDKPIQFSTPAGEYRPRNYDGTFHGPLRLREALACSYNVPAVTLLQAIGPDFLFQRLKSAGFTSLKKSPSYYGIGLTLGNGEVTLLELVRAYSALAKEGIFQSERTILSLSSTYGNLKTFPLKNQMHKIFSPQTVYILTDILSDNDARIPAFGYGSPLNLPFACAVKTGTTKDFRDNWTVGYTPKFTVGVWVGNFDGTPMHNVSGITGCGPLFRDILLLFEKKGKSRSFTKPPHLIRTRICPLSGKLSANFCPGTMEEIFLEGTEPAEFCSLHKQDGNQIQKPGLDFLPLTSFSKAPEIVFPFDGDVYKIDPVLRKNYQVLNLRVSVPDGWTGFAMEWQVNGRKIGGAPFPFTCEWTLKPGNFVIQAIFRNGKKTITTRPVKVSVLS